MTTPGESNTNPGILDELAERLGNFHESARALAESLHTHDITRQTDLRHDRGSQAHVPQIAGKGE